MLGGRDPSWILAVAAFLQRPSLAGSLFRHILASQQKEDIVEEAHPPALPSGAIDPSTKGLFLTVFPSIMLPMFLAVADQTIVASALPAIAAQTGEVDRISWIVVSYLLASTIAAPVYGYLGDMFGRRRLMFVALVVFIAASVLCAASPTITLLSVSRVLQGLGGGGLMSLSQALVGEVVPSRQRGHFQGYLAANATASSAFGPVAGGFLTQHFGWRSVFLVNVPLGLVAIVLALRLSGRPGSHKGAWRFDFVGLILLIAAVVPVLLALQLLQHLRPDQLAMAAGLLALSGVSIFVLARYERDHERPLIPISFIRRRLVWMADALALFHGAALTSLVAFTPLFLRVIHGASAAESGLLLLPITAGIGVGSIVTGRILTRTGRTMVFPSWGLIGATILLLIFAWNSPSLPLPYVAVLLSGAAICMGTVMGVVQVAIQAAAGSAQLGAAAASVQLSRSVGAALGTALFGTVVFASLFWVDPNAGAIFGRVVDMGPQALDSLAAPARQAFVAQLGHAFRAGFLLICCFTTAGLTFAWLNPHRRL
jgi:EmrB/QacA subfamily drug resistance transporter